MSVPKRYLDDDDRAEMIVALREARARLERLDRSHARLLRRIHAFVAIVGDDDNGDVHR